MLSQRKRFVGLFIVITLLFGVMVSLGQVQTPELEALVSPSFVTTTEINLESIQGLDSVVSAELDLESTEEPISSLELLTTIQEGLPEEPDRHLLIVDDFDGDFIDNWRTYEGWQLVNVDIRSVAQTSLTDVPLRFMIANIGDSYLRSDVFVEESTVFQFLLQERDDLAYIVRLYSDGALELRIGDEIIASASGIDLQGWHIVDISILGSVLRVRVDELLVIAYDTLIDLPDGYFAVEMITGSQVIVDHFEYGLYNRPVTGQILESNIFSPDNSESSAQASSAGDENKQDAPKVITSDIEQGGPQPVWLIYVNNCDDADGCLEDMLDDETDVNEYSLDEWWVFEAERANAYGGPRYSYHDQSTGSLVGQESDSIYSQVTLYFDHPVPIRQVSFDAASNYRQYWYDLITDLIDIDVVYTSLDGTAYPFHLCTYVSQVGFSYLPENCYIHDATSESLVDIVSVSVTISTRDIVESGGQGYSVGVWKNLMLDDFRVETGEQLPPQEVCAYIPFSNQPQNGAPIYSARINVRSWPAVPPEDFNTDFKESTRNIVGVFHGAKLTEQDNYIWNLERMQNVTLELEFDYAHRDRTVRPMYIMTVTDEVTLEVHDWVLIEYYESLAWIRSDFIIITPSCDASVPSLPEYLIDELYYLDKYREETVGDPSSALYDPNLIITDFYEPLPSPETMQPPFEKGCYLWNQPVESSDDIEVYRTQRIRVYGTKFREEHNVQALINRSSSPWARKRCTFEVYRTLYAYYESQNMSLTLSLLPPVVLTQELGSYFISYKGFLEANPNPTTQQVVDALTPIERIALEAVGRNLAHQCQQSEFLAGVTLPSDGTIACDLKEIVTGYLFDGYMAQMEALYSRVHWDGSEILNGTAVFAPLMPIILQSGTLFDVFDLEGNLLIDRSSWLDGSATGHPYTWGNWTSLQPKTIPTAENVSCPGSDQCTSGYERLMNVIHGSNWDRINVPNSYVDAELQGLDYSQLGYGVIYGTGAIDRGKSEACFLTFAITEPEHQLGETDLCRN